MARIVDYLLADGCNFTADREAADHLTRSAPAYPRYVRDNAACVRHAVQHMIDAGVRQFVDLGAGMGSRGSVIHLTRAAEAARGGVRVACVELDPVAIAHLDTFTNGDDVSVHHADLFDTAQLLSSEALWRPLDPAEPVGVVLASVLHHEPDATRIATALSEYYDGLADGSMLAVTHLSSEHAPPGEITALVAAHARLGFTLVPRGRHELTSLLGRWLPQLDGVMPIHLGVAVLATKVSPEHAEE